MTCTVKCVSFKTIYIFNVQWQILQGYQDENISNQRLEENQHMLALFLNADDKYIKD